VLRRLIKVSAAALAAGAAALLMAGCSPVKMGAAAIVGDQRITIATLDTAATNLSQAAAKYPGVVQLSQAQITQDTLTWLVRFQINEAVARQAGITITPGQAQQALAEILAEAKAQASASGVTSVTLEEILAANGIPPDYSAEVGRYQAIYVQYVENANGGKIPTSSSAQTATTAKFQHAECMAAKSLKILVNPQFGRMDYSKLQVVSPDVTVTRPEGPVKAGPVTGLAPAC
jgi:hypothetical protein